MGQDYCICKGIFDKEKEAHLLSSNRGQNENNRKMFLINNKGNPSEKETSIDNKLKFENRELSFKDMSFLGENNNQIHHKLRNNYMDNKNDIKEEENEDEMSNKNNSNINNNKNRKELKSYNSSKDMSSNLASNHKNKKQIINLNENKRANDNELNFDKSKKGLGEIYEEKYLGNEKTETKMDEIKKDCDDLCNKLFDIFKQMTNGTATPYGIRGKKEDEINITNMPAIQIEEVGNFISDNKDKIKSGKEMFNPNKIRNKNKEEMTSEELRTIHNRKKRNIKSRIHNKEKKRKLNELTQQLGSKFEAKIKMKQDKDKKMAKASKTNTTEYKSTKFFGKMTEMAEKEGEKKRKEIIDIND
jgi:U3 small nucleolar RNA-associated protein MPP10